MPPNPEPIKTPHLDLSNSFMTSSVIPPSAKAFLPAVSRYSINLSILLESFGATHPSVEKDFISAAIFWGRRRGEKQLPQKNSQSQQQKRI